MARGANWRCNSRTMKIQSMPLRTSSLEFMSLTMVRRGVSTSTQAGPAIARSVRGRPDSRLISPKNSPADSWLDKAEFSSDCSVTEPCTMVKNEVPNSPGS